MNMRKLGAYIKEYSQKNKSDEAYPVYSVTSSNGFCTEYFNKDVSGQDKTNYKIVPRGYFAYNPSRINVGSIDWQNCEENVIVSPLYVIFKCSDKLNQDYLKYFLKSSEGKRLINTKVSGSVRNNLKFEALSQFEFNIVELDEQKDVVAKLKRIEAAINNEKCQIELYDELIKARFVEMFGDPVSNSKGLKELTLPELGEFGRGVSKYRPRNAPELLGGKYPLIQTGEIANAGLYITNYENTYSELGYQQSKIWKAGTLCITIAANIAKTAILTFDACFPDSVVGFSANDKTNEVFIHYWFSFFQSILESQAPESAQKNINLKVLSELKVITPDIEQQNQFALFVAQVDKSKSAAQKRLQLYEELLEQKMSDYFIC